MEFTLSIWMLMPLAITGFAVYILMNHEKVNEKNKSFEERILNPKVMRPTHHDPDGRFHRFGAVGMIVIAALQFVAIGTGLIET